MRNELTSAIRIFRRSPLFAATVLATIALGIGPSAAVFSVVDTVLLRPLPYPDPDRLVRIWGADTKSDRRYLEVSPPEFRALRDEARSLAGVAGFSIARRDLTDPNAQPARVILGRVTTGFFSVLGSSFDVGRGFSDDEYHQQQNVVVLSHRLWLGRYEGRPDVLGRKVYIRQELHEIVGVLGANQEFPQSVDLFRPIKDSEMDDEDRELQVVGRLRSAVNATMAGEEAAAIVKRLGERDGPEAARFTAWAQPLQSMLVRDVRAVLLMLLGAVALVALMVCVNVASLLLARATVRRHEMAIRAAIGAGRGRLAALCLIEGLVLAGAGGVLGIALGRLLLRTMIVMVPEDVPRLSQVGLDARAAAVMAGVTLVCGLLFSLAPAWIESRQDPRDGMSGARSTSGGRWGLRIRRTLVICQIVLSVVMLAGAAQVIASLRHLLEFDRGFRNADLLEVRVGATGAGSKDSIIDLYDRLRRRIGAMPDVHDVELANFSAMDVRSLRLPIGIEGGRANVQVYIGVVSPNYFKALGVPLVDGRLFSPDTDYRTSAPVALVNQAFVDLLSRDRAAVGRHVQTPSVSGGTTLREIVGVVADLKPSVQTIPSPTVYVPFGQEVWPDMHLLIGMKGGDPNQAVSTVRQQIWAEDRRLIVEDAGTLRSKIVRTVITPRFSAAVVTILAVLALILASLGLYGMLSQFVSSRRRELAIRRVVGAAEGGIVMLVVRHGMTLTLVGLIVGIPAAIALSRALATSLYHVRWTDASVLLVPALVLTGVALLACLVPAYRAVRINPVTALRDE